MKAIILAAGQGTRLLPLTEHRPKCMVEIAGKPLLYRQLEVLRNCGVTNIGLVAGYKAQSIDALGVHIFRNADYMSTNMVASLFCASEWLDGSEDILICYGDIVYEARVLQTLLAWQSGPLALTIDKDWRRYWTLRMDDPLRDAETLKIDVRGCIYELGMKPTDYSDIQGQYMGLIRVFADHVITMQQIWRALSSTMAPGGYRNMYMTQFIQHLIGLGWPVWAVPINGGWLEV